MDRIKETEPVFELEERGYKVTVWNLKDNKGDAVVEITRGEELIREFLFPAYKVYNIAAHFSDIVDSEIQKNDTGYRIAGSTI